MLNRTEQLPINFHHNIAKTQRNFTCLEGKGDPENARLSLVAEAETALEHTSETGQQMH